MIARVPVTFELSAGRVMLVAADLTGAPTWEFEMALREFFAGLGYAVSDRAQADADRGERDGVGGVDPPPGGALPHQELVYPIAEDHDPRNARC